MISLITGVVTGGFGFLSEWWKGKQEQSIQKLKIKQETARVKNEIAIKQATAQLDINAMRVRQMEHSWKDEWWLFIYSIPLLNMFVSPFVDLIMIGTYKQGMLAEAAAESLANLSAAPSWYILIIIVMTFLSWGYRKGIDQVLSILSLKKR